MSLGQKRRVLGNGYYRTLIGNPMPVVKPTGQRGPMVTGSGQNGLDLENLHRQYLHNDYYDYY